MANHKSAKKRMRQALKKRTENRFYKKTTRSSMKNLLEITDKKDAETFLPKVISMIDKLAKKNIWHKKKASRLKGHLTLHVNSL